MDIFSISILAAGLGVLIFVFVLLGKKKEKEEILHGLDTVLFSVMMPQYEKKNDETIERDEKNLIGQMEQIFAGFSSLSKKGFFAPKPRISFEIASQIGESDISFYVSVPRLLEGGFEKYIHGIYPRAQVEKVPEDYTIFEPNGKTAGSFLKLSESNFFPISTYKHLDRDPIATITNVLGKIAPSEGVALQLVARPFPQKNWRETGNKILNNLREGKTAQASVSEATRPFLLDFLAGFFESKPKQDPFQDRNLKADEATMQAIQEKIQKQIFEVNIRLVSSAKSKDRAEEILGHLEGSFSQFSSSGLNGLKVKRLKGRSLRRLAYDFSFRRFNPAQKNILNIEELASLYHFPTFYTDTPYVKSVKSTTSAPPSELPVKGINTIGKVSFRGEEKTVSFATREDRRRHFYIIGQTGTGKTSLLKEMIRQDIQNGEGVAVIDPHGELVESTLAQIPKERVEDVVLFEPFDLERPMGLNMLEYDTPEQKDFAVQEMISIFHKLFPPEIIGPMFEHYMRNAMLAIMADKDNPGTLVEIPRMFTNQEFMESRLKEVTDSMVRNFWLKEWKQTTGDTRSDMLGYVVSKVGRFIENEMMRNIIGQSKSGFDLGKVMDEKKIFLANLSKGMTGEVNSSLLGLILVSKMQMAAMKRARVPEEERKDFYLYIDEFQNFTTDSITTILSEARKYRLNLVLAHQYITQLTEPIRNAVLGNVGTIGVFRVGAEDAQFLEKQFEPEFSRMDLVNIDNFNFCAKIMIDNKVYPPFKMQTIMPAKGNPKIVEPIKKLAKLKYGRPKKEVEAEINQRSNL